MTEVLGYPLDLNDPLTFLALGGFGMVALVLIVVIGVWRVASRSIRVTEPLVGQIGALNSAVQSLNEGQHALGGGLRSVSEAQANAQVQMVQTMEARLAHVQQQMSDTLHANALKSANSMSEMQTRLNEVLAGNSEKTAKSLTQLQERLATIDKAQTNIEKLSGDVLSLQDILSNKQTRGAFGEIQLADIVSKALPSDAFAMQATLGNGKRADCLIRLPNPPGPIVIDSKFPLEAYEKLRTAQTQADAQLAAREMRTAVRTHIKAISEKYIVEGETADGALMFLPSEAVYAELHANFPEVVREGFAARVWIVSPTTCMATLNTMRAVLKDARMREQAGAIRKTLGLLHRDVELVLTRVGKLETHFNQARQDIDDITVAAERAGKRAVKLDNFDFEELEREAPPTLQGPATAAE
ncbi:MAG: DNA recombination protein RmuC [Dinoroseobacter sp.]|nr:DNA recombination protein RmuC [Dinoroseobacter sp.]